MLYSGDIVDNTYNIINEIGSGGMGVVYLAYHLRLQKYVVMKKIKSTCTNETLLRNEVDILKGLHHPYLPQVYDIISYEGDVYTIIDYIDGKDLDRYIKEGIYVKESQLIKWLRQLCEVLCYLHNNNPAIIHTDIKPANIIVRENGDICLIDFGISLSADDTVKGYSRNYSSPEQYINVLNIINGYTDGSTKLDGRSDIYSLGATFYHLMTGCLPDVEDEYLPLLSEYDLPYSDALVSIVEKAMNTDINRRYKSAEKMLAAIDNIRRQDSRYKKYFLLQIATSVIAGIMICFGVLLMVTGNTQMNGDEFSNVYSRFVTYCNKGDTASAEELGMEILSNSKYRNIMDNNKKSELLHYIGDCCFNEGDYLNAAENYKNAYECGNSANGEICLRDYAIAMIRSGKTSDAERVTGELEEKYPDSSAVGLLKAETAYRNGNFAEAEKFSDNCISTNSKSDNAFSALLLKGDIMMRQSRFDEAVDSYEQAKSIYENINVLRKLGLAYLEKGSGSGNSNDGALAEAINYYKIIRDKYFLSAEDTVNFSECYRRSDNLQDAKALLEFSTAQYQNDYRIYIQLATVCAELGDSQTADYCSRARTLYKALSDEEKQKADVALIDNAKSIYRRYVGSAW